MATTATITLTSADIAGDSCDMSKTATCTKAGTTTDLDQTTGVNRVHLRATTQKTLLSADTTNRTPGDNLAGKVYIINKATDASLYLTISINAQTVGKLYAGDWMFIPWSQTDANASIKVAATNWTASTGDIPVEYALFHEDTDFLTNA